MTRSYRHTPIFGHTLANSEKDNKRDAHRAFRRISRQAISSWRLDRILFSYRQISDVWSWAKDGKSYWMPRKITCYRIPRPLEAWHRETNAYVWHRAMRK